MEPFKRSIFPRAHVAWTYFTALAAPHRATTASWIIFILIEDRRPTHTQKPGPVTHIPACVCLFVWICVHPWGGQWVQNYYTGTFSPAYITHTDKQDRLSVCVCVCVKAERACFAGGEGREVSSGGNKSICWLLTEWEIKTSQWSIFITSLPLSFICTRICFSRSHDIQLSLSLFLSSCLALMVVLWCYGWSLHPHEEREHWFPCWMTAVQGRFGNSAALPENEPSPPDTFKQRCLEQCWEEPLSSHAVCHGQYGFVRSAAL